MNLIKFIKNIYSKPTYIIKRLYQVSDEGSSTIEIIYKNGMYKHITKGMYVGVIEKDIKSKDLPIYLTFCILELIDINKNKEVKLKDKRLNDLNILYKKYT